MPEQTEDLDLLRDIADATDMELWKLNTERANLAGELAVLRDHVAAMEADTRVKVAAAINWDTLRHDIARIHTAGVAGVFPPARVVDEVIAAFLKAVTL
ncbi:hypothetical protein AB0L65_32820 [Nonomuraea sp. NPDC052116]|uniref:hypothetical protein n=1 Tax=Nonomuraea sp. NPDC052116 TaxID=3155665 RepID=UPI0034416534